ncbi:MAG: LPS export ABC transporter periplasmic protein LptC [Bacteroidetes bacterium]|nr:LPS export ABC transporter periplasmic protein LptC [Bacteroidota bacterium]
MRNKYYFNFSIFFLSIISIYSVKSKTNKIVSFSANSLEYNKEDDKELNKLYGNVVFTKHNLKIFADEAEYEEQKKIAAKGNVVIVKTRNDGSKIRILTNSLTYYVDNEVAEFLNEVTLIDGKNVLKSNIGEYNDAEDTANFYSNVRVENDEQLITCDILSYKNIDNKILKDHSELFEGLTIKEEQRKKIYLAEGNLKIKIKKDKIDLKSDYFAYYKEEAKFNLTKERIKLYGNPILKKEIKNDEFYLYADLMLIQKNKISTNNFEKNLKAKGNVSLYNKDLKAKSNEITYLPSKELVLFGINSIFWTEDSQFTANEAKIIMKEDDIKEMHLNQNALLIQKDEYKKYNQIRGEKIRMLFSDNKVYKMTVEENAQSIQFLSNEKDSGLVGINHIKCDKIKILLKDNKAKKVEFLGKSYKDTLKGLMMAPKNLNEQNSKFQGFSWRPEEKPTYNDIDKLMHNRPS